MNNTDREHTILFDHLFRQYYHVLKAYAYKYIEDSDAVEDIVQDVFFELWLKKNSLDLSFQLKQYLFKSVFNKCLNFLNNSYKKRKVSFSNSLDDEIKDIQGTLSQFNQEDLLMFDELINEINTCINNLPEQNKKVFMLKHTYGLKNQEIADQLRISIKTVEKHMTKTLLALRNHLKKCGLFSFL